MDIICVLPFIWPLVLSPRPSCYDDFRNLSAKLIYFLIVSVNTEILKSIEKFSSMPPLIVNLLYRVSLCVSRRPGLALVSNLYLPALAPNFYLPALVPNLCFPNLIEKLHLPALVLKLYLPTLTVAMAPSLYLPVQDKILLLLPQLLVLSLPQPLLPPLLLQLLPCYYHYHYY